MQIGDATGDNLDEIDGTLSIRDIKEQECRFGEPPPRDEARRYAAFVEGWKRAASKVLATGEVETLMPHDLCAPKTLDLVTAHTAEDFETAHLAKSRLGRWIR